MSRLEELIRKAQEAFDRLSPEEQRAYRREQAISFVYGNLNIDRDEEIPRSEIERMYDER